MWKLVEVMIKPIVHPLQIFISHDFYMNRLYVAWIEFQTNVLGLWGDSLGYYL